MTDRTITELVKTAPLLTPEDTVRRAAGLIRGSEGSSLLVLADGGIMGRVSEQAIAGLMSSSDDPEKAFEQSVASLIEPNVVFVNTSMSLKQAAEVFASTGADVVPVIGAAGTYQGVLYRQDVVGCLTNTLRPPLVAGMATPLGVYLTTGSLRGGVSNLGLFLAGVSLMLMIAVAALIVGGLQSAFQAVTGIRVDVFLASPALTMRFNIYDLAIYIQMGLTIVIMLLLLRLSPLSGYHAAEHMTVHAIEAGEALTSDNVRRMPRVHARCGTNLLAAAGIFLIIATRMHSELAVLLALVVVFVGWRAVGSWLQYFVTTKNPSENQLANGVAAGNELIRRFQERPNYQVYGFQRIWNMGFLQTASGMMAVGLLGYLLQEYAHMAWLGYFLF